MLPVSNALEGGMTHFPRFEVSFSGKHMLTS